MLLTSTSSGLNGWSRLSLYLACPALAASVRANDKPQMLSDEPRDEKGKNKPMATLVGSIFGELSQRYLLEKPVMPNEPLDWQNGDGSVQSLDVSHPESVKEARRLYVAYTKKYRPDHLGRVIATEMPIVIPGDMFGVDFDIHGNIDLVVQNEDGKRVWDIKTDGREDVNIRAKYSLRHQLWVYALGYELMTGEKPVGTGIDCTIKTKEVKFRKFEYEGMTDKRFAWLADAVLRVRDGMMNPRPNPSLNVCWPYGTSCTYLIDDMCSI